MNIERRTDRASGAFRAWRKTYYENARGEWRYGDDKESIAQKLYELGLNPAPEQVNEVIGNESWTRVRCEECGESVEVAVTLGEPPDYESATATICKACLINALDLITEDEGAA